VGEGRRAVVRALRRRLAELETSAFENLCASLLDKMGMRDVRVAKRSKEGPLYLARQRRGVSDLRVAVKLVRGGREIGRQDVQELRKDLAHYSAQMGLVLAPGEGGRDARSEASAAGQAPVALYVGEALPEELIALRVGVTVQLVEVADVDEAFFAGLSRRREEKRDDHRRDREDRPERDERPDREPRHEREERPQEEARPAQQEAAPEQAAQEAAEQPPEPAPEPAPAAEAWTAPPEPPPLTEAVDTAEAPAFIGQNPEENPREGRRRRGGGGGREDKVRATTAAEQAWGQPAGTLRFASPPGPTVAIPAPREEPAAPDQPSDPEGSASEGEQEPH
jgi:ribonuclease E